MTEPEYIYGGWWGGVLFRSSVYRFRVTKRTPKRIYYQRPGERIDQDGNPYDEEMFGIKDSELPQPEASIGSIDRQQFEGCGQIHNPTTRHDGEDHMYVDLAVLIAKGNKRKQPDDELKWMEERFASYQRTQKILDRYGLHDIAKPIDLTALKQAMVAAHPHKGGNSAAFIKARAEYVAARRAVRRK